MLKHLTSNYNIYFADFETTGKIDYEIENEVRVYLWGIKNMEGTEHHGTNIHEFLWWLTDNMSGNNIIYFHNLKFDSSFILSALIEEGYVVEQDKKLRKMPYAISYLGDGQVVYSVDLISPTGAKISIRDSLKLFPGLSIEELGKNVGFKKLKENITYNRRHEPGELIDDKELEYMLRDIEILRLTMIKHFEETEGVIHLTRAAYAESAMKEFVGKANFKAKYGKFDFNEAIDMRSAYFGGFVFVNQNEAGKVKGRGLVFDNNSMFPGVMSTAKLPYGKPLRFEGSYEDNESKLTKKGYDLYVIKISNLKFSLKPGHIASLPKQLGYTTLIRTEDDLKDYNKKGFMLSSLDLKHFRNNYDITNVTFEYGYAFKSEVGPFKDFVNYYGETKKKAKYGPFKSDEERKTWEAETGEVIYDKMSYLSSKLILNSSYGKFGQKPFQDNYDVTLNEDGKLEYSVHVRDDVKINSESSWHYIPMAIFITAGGRDILLNAAEKAPERVMYMDTDSLHLLGTKLPEGFDNIMSETELGKWKIENTFENAKWLRDKTYAEFELVDETYTGNTITYNGNRGRMIIKAAGISSESKDTIKSFDDFSLERYYDHNRRATRVKGGTLIEEVSKKIKNTLIR